MLSAASKLCNYKCFPQFQHFLIKNIHCSPHLHHFVHSLLSAASKLCNYNVHCSPHLQHFVANSIHYITFISTTNIHCSATVCTCYCSTSCYISGALKSSCSVLSEGTLGLVRKEADGWVKLLFIRFKCCLTILWHCKANPCNPYPR